MAGAPTKRAAKRDTETRVQFVRFNDLKSQSHGRFPERTDRPALSSIQSPSRLRQGDDSSAKPERNERRDPLEDLRDRDGTDSGDKDFSSKERETMGTSQRQDPSRLRRNECTERDITGSVAEEFRLQQECRGCARDQQSGHQYTAGGLSNKRDNDSLGGQFFHEDERINLYQEELWRCAKNRNPLSRTPIRVLRKESMKSVGSTKSLSHSSSRSRSTARGSNVDCPQWSHSRSGSLSSSRCITPRRSGRNHAIPFREESFLQSSSGLRDPAPEDGFDCHVRDRTIFSREYALSQSKGARSRGPLIPNTTTVSPQRSSNGIEVSAPRRITLIERYQRGLMLRKPFIRRKKSRCPSSLPGEAWLASGAKDRSFMRYEGYWRGKSEEGLCPLRSPWRDVPDTIPFEDPRSLDQGPEQLPPDKFRSKTYRPPEFHDPPDTRRESQYHCASPYTFNDSFRHDDPYDSNSYPALNHTNALQKTVASMNNRVPQITRDRYLSTDAPYGGKLRSSYDDNADATRKPCSYDDPLPTKDSYKCTRCLAAEGLASANDGPNSARNFSWENEDAQTTTDSFTRASSRLTVKDTSSTYDHDPYTARNFSWQNVNRQTTQDSSGCNRPRLASKGSSSANDDPCRARNFSWEDGNPQTKKDLIRCVRPRLPAKDTSSANIDPHTARNFSSQNENSHKTKDSFWFGSHRLAEKDASSTNDDPHSVKNFSWQNVNPQTTQTGPRLAAKGSSSVNDDPRTARNFSWEDGNPQPRRDLIRCARPRLPAKDTSSANDDPKPASRLSCQNEQEESRAVLPQFQNPPNARASWRQNDLYEAGEVFHPFSAREVFDDPVSRTDSWWYNEQEIPDEERNAKPDSMWRSHQTDAEMEASSFAESHRDSWRPDLGRKTASKFEETRKNSWRQTDPQASPFPEPSIERDSWRNSNSDAARRLSTKSDLPSLAPGANLRRDNTSPIRRPCYRPEEDDLSVPLSSRHYGQPQSNKPFQSPESYVYRRVAARSSVSVRNCGTKHYEVDDSTSSSRPREKKGMTEIPSS